MLPRLVGCVSCPPADHHVPPCQACQGLLLRELLRTVRVSHVLRRITLIRVHSFRFISTMETETISGRNIAELLMQEEFNASICKPSNTTEPGEPPLEDFVYGWDC